MTRYEPEYVNYHPSFNYSPNMFKYSGIHSIREMEEEEMTMMPTLSPTITLIEDPEETHESDAYAAVFLNITLIGCVLLAYYIKKNRIYYIPESAAAMIVGVLIGGMAKFLVSDLTLYKFSPEVFFFVLLPPIIFEAGYSLSKKHFFENFGAITMFAMAGTIISTFIVGYATFAAANWGWISGVSTSNPMEALLFGALISAVDPVATLSIMGSPELQCNQLLYSLVFGESVLNDAIAIVLFKTFYKYYDPDAPDLTKKDIPSALLAFLAMTVNSIIVGVILGLVTSFIYKHTSIREFPHLETSLLFLFCYFCYATAEAMGLSGIMALFFNGICLSHYNSYNLSDDSKHATESIFSTLATVTETIVFLYMGMGVFTMDGRLNFKFAGFAMFLCVLGRACNIFPLSFLSNLCRKKDSSRITYKMQFVLWFAGLRGAIAFALAQNMPGPNRETYASGTLVICIFTTVICGGFTEKILTRFGMKQSNSHTTSNDAQDEHQEEDELFSGDTGLDNKQFRRVYKGVKGLWKQFDDYYLKTYFGGSTTDISSPVVEDDDLGSYELKIRTRADSDEEGNSAESLSENINNSKHTVSLGTSTIRSQDMNSPGLIIRNSRDIVV
mmetsp:Transcript_1590/g.2263  ORF Transcript_1590/g.2263 Transcript_1590/m.2263 type:complete len:614 (+) Transcript_1590:160-2001(+)|eukprot:CAMPEP_0184857972 /NCGR_PEP_ID=MMETSP0580-20130426/3118_1 /TAXON_ID=1118495 /ORGANISM="Dactyliosolen fragilissimus" /LENGTH=613 /DNA_ID=CAMNT_0027353877 /DNA_START=66 /DNA_END=1907 /DNA_ORIENTATION=+